MNTLNFVALAIVIPLIVSVIANLMTPRVKDWWATTSTARRDKRRRQLEEDLEWMQSFEEKPYKYVLMVLRWLVLAFTIILCNIFLDVGIHGLPIPVSGYTRLIMYLFIGDIAGTGVMLAIGAAFNALRIGLDFDSYQEKTLKKISKLTPKKSVDVVPHQNMLQEKDNA